MTHESHQNLHSQSAIKLFAKFSPLLNDKIHNKGSAGVRAMLRHCILCVIRHQVMFTCTLVRVPLGVGLLDLFPFTECESHEYPASSGDIYQGGSSHEYPASSGDIYQVVSSHEYPASSGDIYQGVSSHEFPASSGDIYQVVNSYKYPCIPSGHIYRCVSSHKRPTLSGDIYRGVNSHEYTNHQVISTEV